jgi:serine/threonine protein kinase
VVAEGGEAAAALGIRDIMTTQSAHSSDDAPNAQWNLLAKVSDFGLAVKMDPSQQHVSNLRQGTPFYIAPEVRECGRLGFAADSHAFGVSPPCVTAPLVAHLMGGGFLMLSAADGDAG